VSAVAINTAKYLGEASVNDSRPGAHLAHPPGAGPPTGMPDVSLTIGNQGDTDRFRKALAESEICDNPTPYGNMPTGRNVGMDFGELKNVKPRNLDFQSVHEANDFILVILYHTPFVAVHVWVKLQNIYFHTISATDHRFFPIGLESVPETRLPFGRCRQLYHRKSSTVTVQLASKPWTLK
jgi:hypothetical protein